MDPRLNFDDDKHDLGHNNPNPSSGPNSLPESPKSSSDINSNVSPSFAGPRRSFVVPCGEPENEIAPMETSKNSSSWINAIVSGIIALFYAALIVVSVLVCLYSIKSLYITSNIPVTSTTIEEQDENFEPPGKNKNHFWQLLLPRTQINSRKDEFCFIGRPKMEVFCPEVFA